MKLIRVLKAEDVKTDERLEREWYKLLKHNMLSVKAFLIKRCSKATEFHFNFELDDKLGGYEYVSCDCWRPEHNEKQNEKLDNFYKQLQIEVKDNFKD